MDNTLICYCDKCGKPIAVDDNLEHQDYNLCPDCALALYQKIFERRERMCIQSR